MAEYNNCDDPQFVNALETCVREEINRATVAISDVKNATKQLKLRVRTMLLERKFLKQKVENQEKNVRDLMNRNIRQKKSSNDAKQRAELMRLGLDDKFRIMEIEQEYYRNIMKETEKTWELYHAGYENFPLAKIRKQEWIELRQAEIRKMILEAKILECKKILRIRERIAWMKMRGNIVTLAGAMIANMNYNKELAYLTQTIRNRENELKQKQAELETAKKMQEEKKKIRERERLEMPPPAIVCNAFRSMRRRSGFLEHWQQTKDLTSNGNGSDWDSLSVDTLMLEEMCEYDCESTRDNSSFTGSVQSKSCEGQIDAGSVVCSDQEVNQEVEQQDAVNEVDRESIAEKMEYKVDRESESDGRGSEDNRAEEDDPVSKKMRLIFGEATGSVTLSERSDKRKSAVPRVVNIETIPPDVPQLGPFKAMGTMSNVSKQIIGDKSSIVEMSGLEKYQPGNSPSVCSSRFDYADISNISFASNLHKVDEPQLGEPSLSDLCEHSTVSMPSEELSGTVPNNNPQPSTSNTNFLNFSFTYTTKPDSGNLF